MIWKNTRHRTGVYCIRNTINGKRYIGSAAHHFNNRRCTHFKQLNDGVHHSKYLQQAWNKYGEAAFVFEVMLVCAPADCVMYEQRCIDQFNCADGKSGYNCSPTAGSPLGVKRTPEQCAAIGKRSRERKITQETRDKISAAGRGRKRSAETIAQQKATRKANGKKVRPRTPEELARHSARMKGRLISAETRAKIAAALRGKKHSPERIANIVAARHRTKPAKGQLTLL